MNWMEWLTTLLREALNQCFECGVISWTPDDGMPESFLGEVEIQANWYHVGPQVGGYENGDYFVTLFDVLTIIDAEGLEAWHGEKLEPFLPLPNPAIKRRGFGSMTPEQRQRIASLGGKAAHRLGVAHHWTAGPEAQDAGRKGGARSSRAGVPNRKQTV